MFKEKNIRAQRPEKKKNSCKENIKEKKFMLLENCRMD